MRALITTALVLLSCCLFAQRQRYVRYNQLLTQADVMDQHGDHARALAVYDSAFALIPWVAEDHVPAVLAALSAGADDRANALLLEAVENGLEVEHYYSPALLRFLNSGQAQAFLDNWGYMQQRFLAHADTAAIAELKAIGTGKHLVREASGDTVVRTDTTAIDRFIALVKLRGFPTARTLGPISGLAQRLLADQAPDYPDGLYWRILSPYINKEIARGTLEPEFLCLFQDIADHDHGRPLTFGVAMHRYLGEPIIRLDAHERIDRARAALGLSTIERAIEQQETYKAKFVFEEEPDLTPR